MTDDSDAFDDAARSLRDLAEKKASELREHCESVVIICTMNEGERTF